MTSPAEKVREVISEEIAKHIEKIQKNGDTTDVSKIVAEQVAAYMKEAQARQTSTQDGDYIPDLTWTGEVGQRKTSLDVYGIQDPQQRNMFLRRKSIDSSTSVPGSQVASIGAWHKPFNRPVFRQYAVIEPVSVGNNEVSEFKTAELTDITVGNRTSETKARTYGGTLTSSTHTLHNRESNVKFSLNAAREVPQLSNRAADFLVGVQDEETNKQFLDAIATSVKGKTSGRVVTGGANKASTKTQILGHLASVLKTIPARYRDARGSMWLMSTDTFETLLQSESSGGEFGYRPGAGLTLYDYEIVVTDQLPKTTADDDVKALFVCIGYSCLIGVGSMLEIKEYDQTEPESVILIAKQRIKEVLLDKTGVAGLVIGAS